MPIMDPVRMPTPSLRKAHIWPGNSSDSFTKPGRGRGQEARGGGEEGGGRVCWRLLLLLVGQQSGVYVCCCCWRGSSRPT